jgi:hypothetical protein
VTDQPTPPPSPTPSGWTPPDDEWDRPVLALRTAWLAGTALTAGGVLVAGVALGRLVDSIATGDGLLLPGLVVLAGVVGVVVGLALLLGALQATMRLRRDRS